MADATPGFAEAAIPAPEADGPAPADATEVDGEGPAPEVDWRSRQGLKARLPLGTLLALAALPVYFGGSEVIRWYRGLFLG